MAAPPSSPVGPFSYRLLRLRKQRAAKTFRDAAFLHRRAAEDLAERLEAIPRRFERALVLGGGGLFSEAVASRASTPPPLEGEGAGGGVRNIPNDGDASWSSQAETSRSTTISP